jgi:glutamate-1-semialdehyde 2,1-aminomutase
MRVFDPLISPIRLPHSGTFSANPITMVAGLATMVQFDRQAVDKLNALSERARQQLREAIAMADVPACVTGAGSMFRIHMKQVPPEDYRSAYPTAAEAERLSKLLRAMEDKGVLLINTGTGMLSTAMGSAEIDRLSDAMLEALRQL